MTVNTKTRSRFGLGRIAITPNAIAAIEPQDVLMGLARHVVGDWGEVSADDWQENLLAVENGDIRIFSAYQTRYGDRFWIITEADRSATTILLPGEY